MALWTRMLGCWRRPRPWMPYRLCGVCDVCGAGLTGWWQRVFTGRGGVLLENSKVTEIVPGPTVTLVTADKVIQADRVILAPGAAVDACIHACVG